MLYVYQFNITSPLQTSTDVMPFISDIQSTMTFALLMNPLSEFIILINTDLDDELSTELTKQKIIALQSLLQINPHIKIQSILSSRKDYSSKQELSQLLEYDKSELVSLYRGMHLIATKYSAVKNILFTLCGETKIINSLSNFFKKDRHDSPQANLIPHNITLTLDSMHPDTPPYKIMGEGVIDDQHDLTIKNMLNLITNTDPSQQPKHIQRCKQHIKKYTTRCSTVPVNGAPPYAYITPSNGFHWPHNPLTLSTESMLPGSIFSSTTPITMCMPPISAPHYAYITPSIGVLWPHNPLTLSTESIPGFIYSSTTPITMGMPLIDEEIPQWTTCISRDRTDQHEREGLADLLLQLHHYSATEEDTIDETMPLVLSTTQDSTNAQTTKACRKRKPSFHPKDSAANTTRIDLENDNDIRRWIKTQQFEYVHDAKRKLPLILDRVAVLGNREKILGVYTKSPIKGNVILSEYIGERCQVTEVENKDYMFFLTTGDDINSLSEVIDARKKRNWTAFVNSSTTDETANIIATLENNTIFYRSRRAIAPGEQLLINYGDYYSLEKKRYLHCKSNALESLAILEKKPDLYLTNVEQLPATFCHLFQIPEDSFFKIPSFPVHDRVSTRQTVRLFKDSPPNIELAECDIDTPCLAVRDKEQEHSFLPQDEQENITLLMIACWKGDLTQINLLLNNNADPNIQSSIHGISALHVAVASEIDITLKKATINLLIKNKAIKTLQDHENQTIIHWAVKKNDIALLEFLLEPVGKSLSQSKKISHAKEVSYLMNFIDTNNRDPWLFSLFLGYENVAHYLLQTINSSELSSYLQEESFDVFFSSIKEFVRNSDSFSIIDSIIERLEEECEFEWEKQKTQIQSLLPTTGEKRMKK